MPLQAYFVVLFLLCTGKGASYEKTNDHWLDIDDRYCFVTPLGEHHNRMG